MQLVFLGTACMTHTKERNQSGILLTYKGENILFDCGEGIQRQMKIAGFRLPSLTKILLSHWHGDHVLGLPGLLQSLAASEFQGVLDMAGPKNIGLQVGAAIAAFGGKDSPVPLRVKEVSEGVVFEDNDFVIKCASLKHSVVCVGFSFEEKDRLRINIDVVKKLGVPDGPLLGQLQEGKAIMWNGRKISSDEATYVVKGRKVVVIVDTVFTQSCVDLAQDADVLICEATYSSKEKDAAKKYKHLTSSDAAQIAAKANVKKLILTHFSQRYKNTQEIEEEARVIFNNVICAKDFMRVTM